MRVPSDCVHALSPTKPPACVHGYNDGTSTTIPISPPLIWVLDVRTIALDDSILSDGSNHSSETPWSLPDEEYMYESLEQRRDRASRAAPAGGPPSLAFSAVGSEDDDDVGVSGSSHSKQPPLRSSIGFSAVFGMNAAVARDACIRFEVNSCCSIAMKITIKLTFDVFLFKPPNGIDGDSREDIIVLELYRGNLRVTGEPPPPILSAEMRQKLSLGQHGFAFGWRFEELDGLPPLPSPSLQDESSTVGNVRGDGGSVLVARPAFALQITHFAEAHSIF